MQPDKSKRTKKVQRVVGRGSTSIRCAKGCEGIERKKKKGATNYVSKKKVLSRKRGRNLNRSTD